MARCGNIYGGGDLNWSRVVPGTIRSLHFGERPVVRSDGASTRDYVYVEDAVAAYLRLAEMLDQSGIRGEAFNFGPSEPRTVCGVVGALQRLMGREDLIPDIRNAAGGEIRHQYLSAEKARRKLAWQPRYSLDMGLEAQRGLVSRIFREGGMNPVLVTGASGFVGGHLVRALVRQGYDVVSVFHKSGLEEDKRHFRLDLGDSAALERLFRQFHFSSVIHLAASGVSADAESFEALAGVNIEATAALGRLAVANGVDRFLHVGTGFEYRPQAHPMDESTPLEAPNLYGASKAAGWILLDALHRLEGLPLVTFRPFSIYGPGEGPAKLVPYTILQALAGEPIRLTLGSQVRDYVFVEDMVEAVRLALIAPSAVGRVYNIGSGPAEACSVRRLVEEILELMGAPPRLCWFDRASRSRRDPPYLVSDPTRAHVELGWRPRVSLAEGLARTIDAYKTTVTVKEMSA